MHMATRSLLSDEEFLALPDAPGKQELLDGELIELPPAKRYHSQIAKRLVRLLTTVLDDSHIWTEVVYWMRKGRWLIPDLRDGPRTRSHGKAQIFQFGHSLRLF